MARRHIKKGDLVQVITGKYKGTQGRVLEVLVEAGRVRVEGVAIVKRHLKPGRVASHPNGGIVEKEGTVHISNVLPVCPETGKPTRVSISTDEAGRRVRVAAKSGRPLDGQSAA